MRRGADSWPFWLMWGLLIYIRPDAILLGVGVFIRRFLREPTVLRRHIGRGGCFFGADSRLPCLQSDTVRLSAPPCVFGQRMELRLLRRLSPLQPNLNGHDSHAQWHLGLGIARSAPFLAISFLVLKTRISRNITQPVVTAFPLQFDLMLGLAVYLGYHVVGGYQHMNFTFRYWIPGLMGAAVVSGEIIRQALSNLPTGPTSAALAGIGARLLVAPVLVGLVALQIVQSGFATYEGKHVDITLTVAPMRDHFSVDSYSEYLLSWYQAGRELSSVVTKDDRLFLFPAMMTGALTKGYLVDQFYFPPRVSKFWDLRQCAPQSAQLRYSV
jgi:hypothetical protein